MATTLGQILEVTEAQSKEFQPSVLLRVAAYCLVAGAFVGASTNAINGAVSPAYFRVALRWDHVQNIWTASIAQGIFEGLIYGVFFSVVFTTVVGLVTRGRCSASFATKHLIKMIVAIYGCWVLGGVIAIGLAVLSPEFYRNTFIGVPEEFGPMLRYAWVGGSIWGAMFGSLLSVVIGSVLFSTRWRHVLREGAT